MTISPAKTVPPDVRIDVVENPDWLAANENVVSLGLLWIDKRLAGETGEDERAAWQEARTDLVTSGRPAAIDQISMTFALSPFEEDVLFVALAAEIDGSFGLRYGTVQGRMSAGAPSPHLLAQLLTGGNRLPVEAMRCLSPLGTLRRFALIEMDVQLELVAYSALRLPERIIFLLCGIDVPDRNVNALTSHLPVVALPDRLEALATRISGSGASPLRVQLLGPDRSGRRAIAAAVTARMNLHCRVLPGGASSDQISTITRDCAIDGYGLLIMADDNAETLRMTSLLEPVMPMPMVVVAQQPVAGLENFPTFRVSAIAPDERLMMWGQTGNSLDLSQITEIAEHFALGPNEIRLITEQNHGDFDGLWAACRNLAVPELEALTTRIEPDRGFGDMVLAATTLAELQMLAAQVSRRAEVHGDWGYRRVLGRATGISALFAGPSGVGKTMAAEAIADALALDLYVVDLARVTSKYIGETEKNLRRIFDAAEAGGCVLFFDEADALFGKRSEIKDSHDRYANAEISYLLQRMESFSGLSILATNLKSHLDTAFLRRIRSIVDFAIPDVEARLALWQRALPPTAPQLDIDYAALARHDLTGGNITTIATNAAFHASAVGQPISMDLVMSALAAEYRKLDRDTSGLGGVR